MTAPSSPSAKYTLESGRVLISGRQALVRLPLTQRRLDQRRGWNTAGFISGYRGSPLGTYDLELWKARELLSAHQIVFQPGLNEDLAATAVWGSQQLGFLPGRRVEGVFGIWYGKGPGVDRSGDPFKHANLQGTEPRGGVLLVFGDDHSGKSSSTAHQSDLALAAHEIPVLYPSCVAEILEYGLAGIALSRFSGLLVGLKLVNETADATATVSLDSICSRFEEPVMETPPEGVHIRKEFLALQQQDARLIRYKLPRALAFARANRLDRITFGSPQPAFAVVTAGKAYADVMAALALLGIDEAVAGRIGLGVYKVAMIYPLEPEGLRAVAVHAREMMFVEEKRPHMERQAAGLLINISRHPRLSGKVDPSGGVLLPADVSLDAHTVAQAIERRLSETIPDIRLRVPAFSQRLFEVSTHAANPPVSNATLKRRPAFCAGCPHSVSTSVPAGSFGMTGIGCHGMAMFFPDRNPLPVTHMGGEGATWLGLGPFTDTAHVFQNLGDGTYNHSGSLAIRAAVQAGVNITYKILYNSAVAMTGGQPVEGSVSVSQIASQVLAEGVRRVVVVSDRPARFTGRDRLPKEVGRHHRDELDRVQRELRECCGVTVLIYDQPCATESRRRRKRAQEPSPDQRAFINHLVCEGCGDCSVQSNCLAIQPLETELGRKRAIDQFACNQDLSCTKGFCPAFVTVQGGQLKRTGMELPESLTATLPEPMPCSRDQPFNLIIAGIGGTGVLTISAVFGTAAAFDGRIFSSYDMTGLSQKGGAVFSHIRISDGSAQPLPARIGREADLLLACDMLAAVDPDAIQTIDPGRTAIVVNTEISAPAAFQSNPDLRLDVDDGLATLRSARADQMHCLGASSLAQTVLGDPIATNMLLLGFAWQRGLIPLTLPSIERAIESVGTAVSLNEKAFQLGRVAAATPEALNRWITDAGRPGPEPLPDLNTFIARRTADLAAYWNSSYAARYASLVRHAVLQESKLEPARNGFVWAVARSAFKLMAYKDEYEVARLFTDGRFLEMLKARFAPDYRLEFHLSPPLWSRPDARTGRPRKTRFGTWLMPLLHVLARLKVLRETPFDPFGWTAERVLERRMRDEFLELAANLCKQLSNANHNEFVLLAEAPLRVRGFGPVKAPAMEELLRQMRSAREQLQATS